MVARSTAARSGRADSGHADRPAAGRSATRSPTSAGARAEPPPIGATAGVYRAAAPRTRLGAALVAGLLVTVAAGCGTGALRTAAAPHASDPACARLLASLPDRDESLASRPTTGAGTAAWGGADAVVLFCGVTPPGPSTEPCVSVGPPGGPEVDWLVLGGAEATRFVTFGRDPAVEVRVPTALAPDQPAAYLVDLSAAVALLPAGDSCS